MTPADSDALGAICDALGAICDASGRFVEMSRTTQLCVQSILQHPVCTIHELYVTQSHRTGSGQGRNDTVRKPWEQYNVRMR